MLCLANGAGAVVPLVKAFVAVWLHHAACVHRHEAPWSANTGNGYFGGMQFSAETWRRMKSSAQPALKHPGDAAYRFAATRAREL